MAGMRLDKYLSDLGIASRKDLKEIIKGGRVSVDDAVVTKPEYKVDPTQSQITLDGKQLSYERFSYYMMDKPTGVVTATEDKKQRTVLDLLPDELKRLDLFPVGRLDKDTSGLLILTNDGVFAHRVISPKSCIEKLYDARVEGTLTEAHQAAFAQGLTLADGTHCLPARLTILGPNECLVAVMEGKYHQVKRMLAACGAPVTELRRLAIGGLKIDESIGPGGIRKLTKNDLCKLFCS